MTTAISQSTPSFQIQQQNAPPSQPMTRTKIQKIALAFFAGACVLFGAALSIAYATEALFIAIPSFVIAGVCVWIITRLKDYADPIELAKYRKEAIVAPFQNTVKKHGWENIYKYQLLIPRDFKDFVLKAAEDMQFKDFLKLYAEGEKKRPATSPLVLPTPEEFAPQWRATAGQLTPCQLLAKANEFDLDQLVRYGFLPQEFLPARREEDQIFTEKTEKQKQTHAKFLEGIKQPLEIFEQVIRLVKTTAECKREENIGLLKEIADLEAKVYSLKNFQTISRAHSSVINRIFTQTFSNLDLVDAQARFISNTTLADSNRGAEHERIDHEYNQCIGQLDSKYSIYLPH